MAADTKRKLEGVGYTALGLGFLFQAAKAFGVLGLGPEDATVPSPQMRGATAGLRGARLGTPAPTLRGLGLAPGMTPAQALRSKPAIISKVMTRTVGDIRDRVSYIQDRIRKDSAKPQVREMALSVLTGKREDASGKTVWAVPEKDYEAEIVALYTAMQDPASPLALRYTRDHVEIDQYHAADKLASLHGPALKGGDCDDGTILLGSMLRAVGYPVRLRVIQDRNSSSWSHIYLLVGSPPGASEQDIRWIPLDWSVRPPKPAGWEAPGAKNVARTGKASGVVVKLMDFAV